MGKFGRFFNRSAAGKPAARNRRLLGMNFKNKPIFEARPGHGLLMAAAGGGKTTSGAIPWLMSMIADRSQAVILTDSKDGEVAAQCMAMCAAFGRKVTVIDDMGALPHSCFHRRLNPFGAISAAVEANVGEAIFSIDNAVHALIEEPSDDARNEYWRSEPRLMLEFGLGSLLKRSTRLAAPGGLWSLLSNPALLDSAAQVEAEEGDETLSALGQHIADLRATNPEHYAQHRAAAAKSLRIFAASSPLHRAGMDAEVTHAELIRDKHIVFLCGPQRHMARLGPLYALHLQSFMEALMGGAGPVTFILDEFTNAPLKALVSGLTTMRGYGGRCLMIAQSRSEIQRKYGEKETATIEENAVIKQWYGFSSFDEAERVSKAMGEQMSVSQGLGVSSKGLEISGNYSLGKERIFTADQLMRLPADEMIQHVKDVGFVHNRKVRQDQIAPYAHHLADNPLEGGRFPPDPKITLPAPPYQPDADNATDSASPDWDDDGESET